MTYKELTPEDYDIEILEARRDLAINGIVGGSLEISHNFEDILKDDNG